MLVALLTAFALQTETETSTDEPPPVVELVPSKAAAPSPPRPPSPSLAPSRVIAPDQPAGHDDVPTAFIQMGVGVGACAVTSCVALPLILVPVAGPVLYNGAVGAGVGAGEALVGDAVGRKEGALLTTIIAGVGVAVVGSSAAIATDTLFPLTSANSVLLGSLEAPDGSTIDVRAGAGAAITAVTTVATLVVPAIVYQLTATEQPTSTLH